MRTSGLRLEKSRTRAWESAADYANYADADVKAVRSAPHLHPRNSRNPRLVPRLTPFDPLCPLNVVLLHPARRSSECDGSSASVPGADRENRSVHHNAGAAYKNAVTQEAAGRPQVETHRLCISESFRSIIHARGKSEGIA